MKKNALKVLVIGSGGREHTLVKSCLNSPLVKEVMAAPGNGGMAQEVKCLPLNVEDVAGTVALCREQDIDLAIIGPEVPLALGVVDALNAVGILAYGPNKAGAQLEASKVFTKNFLFKYDVPTAGGEMFTEIDPALKYLKTQSYPIVVKASGLAAGKGVIIAQNFEEAADTVKDMLSGSMFGKSGEEVVIEECMVGEEASITLIVSGEKYVSLPPSQDHKRIGENDAGPNTGGMGAYAPAAVVTEGVNEQVRTRIIEPTLSGLVAEGIDFRGTLYIGIMITDEGPKVVEFNVRFGDPETQVILPLLKTDLVSLLMAAADGTLEPEEVEISDDYAMVVVLASRGYPSSYAKNEVITFPESTADNIQIIHAGTKLNENGEILSSGGRVLGVTAFGKSLQQAADDAYAVCSQVNWASRYFRRDIGYRQLSRDKK